MVEKNHLEERDGANHMEENPTSGLLASSVTSLPWTKKGVNKLEGILQMTAEHWVLETISF